METVYLPSHSCFVLRFHSDWSQRRCLSNTPTSLRQAADKFCSGADGGPQRAGGGERGDGDGAADKIKVKSEGAQGEVEAESSGSRSRCWLGLVFLSLLVWTEITPMWNSLIMYHSSETDGEAVSLTPH